MPLKVYDDEDQAAQDNLGLTPQERLSQIRQLEADYHAPAAGESPTPTEKTEGTAGKTAAEELKTKEEKTDQQGFFKGRVGEAQAKVNKARGLKARLTQNKKGVGGLVTVVATMAILGLFGLGVQELVLMRENLLSQANKVQNQAMSNRRQHSAGRMLMKLNKGTFTKNINTEKFKAAFEKQGFKVTFEDGKLTEFSYKAGRSVTGQTKSVTRYFDFDSNDPKLATKKFFSGSIGEAASKAYNTAVNDKALTWRGPAGKRVFAAYKFIFDKWLNKKNSKNATTPEEMFAEDLRNAPAEDARVTEEGGKTAKQLEEENKVSAEGKAFNSADALNGELNNGVTPEEYAKELKADPTATDQKVLGVGSNQDIDKLGDGAEKAISSNSPDLKISNLVPAALRGTVEGIFKGLNALGAAQITCEVKGTLAFISNTRNVLFAVELARFAVRILNAADDEKAGIISSTGLNLLMIYLHHPNPLTGRNYAGSAGIQNALGDTKFIPSKAEMTRYSSARANAGFLQSIARFVDTLPGANHCKLVTNGFVSAGGLIVGVGAAIFTGGASALPTIATGITLGVSRALIIQLATPMLIKAGAHLVMNGNENGEMAGDALASGFGELSGMVGSENGLLPSTKPQAKALSLEADHEQKKELASESVFERYFARDNPQSLFNRLALTIPNTFGSIVGSLSTFFGLFHSVMNFGANFAFPGSMKAVAAQTDPCLQDSQIAKWNIATGPFCAAVIARAPDLNPLETEAILKRDGFVDPQGNPTDLKVGNMVSFKEFIEHCFKARPGILYNASPDQSGGDSITDDTCVMPGPILPGDTHSIYDRFATYYGNEMDDDALVDAINNDPTL